MFLRWTPEPSDWHLLQQILVSFLCGEPKWRFFWSVHLELCEILWPSVPPTTAQVMSATWWDVQTSWFAEFPQCTFSPCHLIFREQNKNLVSLFLPTVWLHCEILLLVSSIIYVYLLRPCCRRAGLWHVSHFVYDDGSDWGCPGKHLTWIWCRNGLSWCSYSHKHFRQVTYGQTAVVFVVLRRSRRSLPQIFTSGERHTHPSPGMCCQRWRCLAAHLLTQHRAAKFSSLSGHTCG